MSSLLCRLIHTIYIVCVCVRAYARLCVCVHVCWYEIQNSNCSSELKNSGCVIIMTVSILLCCVSIVDEFPSLVNASDNFSLYVAFLLYLLVD